MCVCVRAKESDREKLKFNFRKTRIPTLIKSHFKASNSSLSLSLNYNKKQNKNTEQSVERERGRELTSFKFPWHFCKGKNPIYNNNNLCLFIYMLSQFFASCFVKEEGIFLFAFPLFLRRFSLRNTFI